MTTNSGLLAMGALMINQISIRPISPTLSGIIMMIIGFTAMALDSVSSPEFGVIIIILGLLVTINEITK